MIRRRGDPGEADSGAAQSAALAPDRRDTATGALSSSLEAYLRNAWDDRAVGVGPLEPFGDGHSGFTYRLVLEVDGSATACILRLSPPGARLTGPSDVGRQGRIMQALGTAGLPVPAVFAYDSTGAVEDRAFALVEQVQGLAWDSAAAAGSHDGVASMALELLAKLQAVDPVQSGIVGEPAVPPSEELQRWHGLLARCPDWLAESGSELAAALAEGVPEAATPCVVHGDYHYGNMLFGDGAVVALLDWEIAEIGDPLVDLGSLAVASLRRRYPDPNPTGGIEISFERLVSAYGTDAKRAAWFVALSCLKYAAILGYNLGLHRSGKRHDPIYEELLSTMSGLVADGTAIARHGSVELA